ncbi:MAG: hypothetical protein ABI707_13365 [Ferruginibacter sp.]
MIDFQNREWFRKALPIKEQPGCACLAAPRQTWKINCLLKICSTASPLLLNIPIFFGKWRRGGEVRW